MKQIAFSDRFNSDDPSERRRAIEGLGRDGEGAIPYLISALKDESPGVQQAAIDALIDMGSAAVVKAVIPLLREGANASLRNMAVEILGRAGSPGAEEIISLLEDGDPDVRKFAADIIGTIKDARGIPTLISALRDQNPNVRSSAANSLGMIGDMRAMQPLLDRLEAEREEWVSFSIIEALGKVGDERIIGYLTRFLKGRSEPLMLASIEVLDKWDFGVVWRQRR